MPTNKYFNLYDYSREQDLVEDLTIEMIKQHGIDVLYIPRNIVFENKLFGEAELSKFEDAIPVEMYIGNVENFEGDGTFLSKFGVEVRDQLTLIVSRKRFDQARSAKVQDEVGYNFVQENGDTDAPSRKFITTPYEGFDFVQEQTPYSITNNRPLEGDLIYFPLSGNLFEIMYVDKEVFYQMGRLQTYKMRCELFEYSSERLETGNTEVDLIANTYSMDILSYQTSLEDNTGNLLGEDGGFTLQEYRLEQKAPLANNELFRTESKTVINWSEQNPFSDRGAY